uniref:Uncharacterized protein n=1 Tax=virus sp. ctML55 TaxID=2827627 RepID=A0A8S5RJ72_9VIRU|nr:MAG TPA: hypothetical protein [virus sp. ctML55]DAW92013.1 MAG TPA: hypothetical protein [Bacteriophage sp.]
MSFQQKRIHIYGKELNLLFRELMNHRELLSMK